MMHWGLKLNSLLSKSGNFDPLQRRVREEHTTCSYLCNSTTLSTNQGTQGNFTFEKEDVVVDYDDVDTILKAIRVKIDLLEAASRRRLPS